jgi:hypothetical protein
MRLKIIIAGILLAVSTDSYTAGPFPTKMARRSLAIILDGLIREHPEVALSMTEETALIPVTAFKKNIAGVKLRTA